MKKILLIGVLAVLGTVSYGRDHEYRSGKELDEMHKEYSENMEKLSRITPEDYKLLIKEEKKKREINMKNYHEFHRELATMDRGHENK
ncbi:hypothetical protein PM10SUCC1_36070 [Propionigenium maris DSM 9537]|uniref:Uncharacterized protein n=1 Tax=Propionigenium maris DSM 9537 TaxID=1123000 RepID=A0A9W6GNX7_9FUSO|nr:hypothetical protein [Propionigenium maris]GLI58093.1 hypothetical protein PM10SUCC1_36070 [Propionigenium maris DSM 9537]